MSTAQQIERENNTLKMHFDYLKHIYEKTLDEKKELSQFLTMLEQRHTKLEQEIIKLKQELAAVKQKK
jgi:cell division protein FtsB